MRSGDSLAAGGRVGMSHCEGFESYYGGGFVSGVEYAGGPSYGGVSCCGGLSGKNRVVDDLVGRGETMGCVEKTHIA